MNAHKLETPCLVLHEFSSRARGGRSTAKRVDCSGLLLDAKPDPCLAPDSRAQSGKRHAALADRHRSCLQPCSPSRAPPPPIVWLAKDGARNRSITRPEHRTQAVTPAKPAIRRPLDWRARVKRAETQGELEALRRSLQRGQPFGSEAWCERIVRDLGLESTVRSQGRPRKRPSS
jgi:hypothetical protein